MILHIDPGEQLDSPTQFENVLRTLDPRPLRGLSRTCLTQFSCTPAYKFMVLRLLWAENLT
jgi:hypothetical protein